VVKDHTTIHPNPTVYSLLTAREREVLELIATGKNNSQIARLLRVSVKTAETHRQHIMQKLGTRSVAKLTKYALREGLTSLEI
jgi:DNA-binding NarL/FixJ family response regulator